MSTFEKEKSTKLKRFICIEYPGVVNDVDKMLTTLGGMDKISEVYADDNRRLELRFRPSDIYSKPACGERDNSTSLLIKVIRRKKKIKKDTDRPSPETYHTQPIGVVHTTFKFDNLCDFQYLPMQSTPDGTKLESIYHHLLPQGIQSTAWLDEDAPLFIPPAIFSRMDTPQDYRYKKEPLGNGSKSKGSVNVICRTRQKRSHYAIFQNFKDDGIPEEPLAESITQIRLKFLENESYNRVKDEFEDRPIWSKNALRARIGFNKDKLKYLLPTLSYYCNNGPWRNLWVRFGYDPRKDRNAWVYQTFDFRVRQAGGMKTKVEAKRSYSNYVLPYRSVNISKKKSSIIQSLHLGEDGLSEANKGPSKGKESSLEDTYIFRPGTVPPYRQMFYQYCDIHVPEIHKYLEESILSRASHICSEKNGWLPTGVENKCRDILSSLVEKTLEQKSEEEMEIKESADSYSEGEDSPDENTTEDEIP